MNYNREKPALYEGLLNAFYIIIKPIDWETDRFFVILANKLPYFASIMGLRQEKFSKQIQRDLGEIFQLHRHDWLSGEFITISGVQSSPDLGHVKIYVSLYNADQKQKVMENFELYGREIRMELAKRLKNTVKKIPELSFFEDDTLDYMNKMDKIFQEIHKNEPNGDSDSAD